MTENKNLEYTKENTNKMRNASIFLGEPTNQGCRGYLVEIERLQARIAELEKQSKWSIACNVWTDKDDDLVAEEEECTWINENETNTSIWWAYGCTKFGTHIEEKSDKGRLIRCPNCNKPIRYIEENND